VTPKRIRLETEVGCVFLVVFGLFSAALFLFKVFEWITA